MNRFKICELGVAALSLVLSMNAWAATLAQQCGAFGIVTYDPHPYEAWADANDITGAWNETSGGVYNVFRYVFDVTSGVFEETPLIDIDVEDDKVVVKTPPVVNAAGVTISVVESSDVAGETITDTKELTEEGSAEFTKDSAAESRFYRLSAEVAE